MESDKGDPEGSGGSSEPPPHLVSVELLLKPLKGSQNPRVYQEQAVRSLCLSFPTCEVWDRLALPYRDRRGPEGGALVPQTSTWHRNMSVDSAQISQD